MNKLKEVVQVAKKLKDLQVIRENPLAIPPLKEVRFTDPQTGEKVLLCFRGGAKELFNIYYLDHGGLKTQYTKQQLGELIGIFQQFHAQMTPVPEYIDLTKEEGTEPQTAQTVEANTCGLISIRDKLTQFYNFNRVDDRAFEAIMKAITRAEENLTRMGVHGNA
jgi:hypothetical protein